MLKSRLPLIAYAIAVVVIVLDQITKAWIVDALTLGQSIQVLPFLKWTLVHNTGFSYGLMHNSGEIGRWLLCLFSLAVAITLAVWVRKADKRLSAVGVGLIIGGAVGNLIDRARLGWVIDFVNFGELFPWVFNVADAAISVGVVLFLIELVLTPDKKPASPSSDQSPL